MRIIVALDIIDGKCVRLTRGDYSTGKIYNEFPVEVARQIEDHGINFLHLVDLDGAMYGHPINYKILEKITGKTKMKVDFGGGIRSASDLRTAFNCGAHQVTCGSIAVSNPTLFLEWLVKWGSEKIILGADFVNRKISMSGWTESSDSDVVDFIRNFQSKGVKYAICTDIEKDGMLQGPSVNVYKDILKVEGIGLIASGGISSVTDIEKLNEIGCEGVIIGKAVYEQKVTLKELSKLC